MTKPGHKRKAALKLVPLFKEPFRRLVIDTLGPLPQRKAGWKYVFTMLCPATKFSEAILLRYMSWAEIVDALLSTFTRVDFSAEIQVVQGTFFRSA